MHCECSNGLLNTGAPNQKRVIANGVKLILVPLFKADGTLNFIDKTDTLNQAFFDGKVAAPNKKDRWYPTPTMVNVTDERADSVTEAYSNGNAAVVQQGVRTFTGWAINSSPKLKQQLDSFACFKFGVYGIDPCGNLVAAIGGDGNYYPISVFETSLDNTVIKATDTTAGKIQITFQYDQLENDSRLRVIKVNEMGGANLLRLEGLIDIQGEVTGTTTTSLTVSITEAYDSELNPPAVEGLPVSAFTLFNVTDNSAVTVTSVTENPDGEYVLSFSAQTVADVLRLTALYGGKEMAAVTATVPA